MADDDSIVDSVGNPLGGTGAGNGAFTAGQSYTVDHTSPDAPVITSTPADPTSSTSAAFSFTTNDPTVGGVASGVNHSECRIDGGGYSTCVSGASFPVLEGTHTFDVRAVDNAGNSGSASSFTWTVDTTAPVISGVTDAPDPTDTSSDIVWSLDDDATVTVKVYDGSDTLVKTLVNGVPETGGINSVNWDLTDDGTVAVPNGTYTYKIDAVDNVGNAAVQQTGTISVQKATKLAFTSTPISILSGETSGLVTVEREGAAGDPVTVGSLTVYLSTDSATGELRDAATGLTPITSVTIPDGASSASFRYYDTIPATVTISAADQAAGPDTGLTDASQQETVNAATTLTTITSDTPDPSKSGAPVTVEYTVEVVAPGTGTPTGTVTVTDAQSAATCSGSVEDGSCVLTLTGPATHHLTATFASDNIQIDGSTSAVENHVVQKADTTTTITNAASLSSTSTVVGGSYAVNWSVSVDLPGVGTPTGTVTVSDGTATCSDDVAAGTCSLTSTSAGAKTITVTYSGDAELDTSFATTTHQVDAAATTTVVVSDDDSSVFGQPVTFTATVTTDGPSTATPVGTVEFFDGATSLGLPVAVDGLGQAQLTTSGLSVDSHDITAVFADGSDFGGSTSDAITQSVAKADTTTTIASDLPDPSASGEPVTVTFTVVPVAPGAGTPAGLVTVTDADSAATCSDSVANGSCVLTFSGPGTHHLTATYAGDADFNGSASAVEDHEVVKAATTTTITSVSADPTVVGESYDVSWTTTVDSPATGTPTGTVTVSRRHRQLLGGRRGRYLLADLHLGRGEDADRVLLG